LYLTEVHKKIHSANKLNLQLTYEMGREYSMHMDKTNVYKILIRKPKEKRGPERCRHR
jgi:hypothetical protein